MTETLVNAAVEAQDELTRHIEKQRQEQLTCARKQVVEKLDSDVVRVLTKSAKLEKPLERAPSERWRHMHPGRNWKSCVRIVRQECGRVSPYQH